MKKLVLSFAMAAAFAATAQADESAYEREGFYLGLKTGDMNSDIDNSDLESSKGVVLGWEFNNGVAVEYEHTESDFEYELNWSFDTGFGTVSGTHLGDGDFETDALYAVYRAYNSSGFFMKLKAGYLTEDISATVVDEDGDSYKVSEDDSGVSAGIGAGYRAEHFSLEAEYTIIEEDVQFFSVGVNAHF